MTYVDGFVLCVKQDRLGEYKEMAAKACEIWLSHGALDYKECIAEDTEDKGFGCMTFPQLAKPADDEVVIFAYIVFKSRENRDVVNKKVMEDERMKDCCGENGMPFDVARMAYSGFETIIESK